MRRRWNIYVIKLLFLTILILHLEVHECCTLNSEGFALFGFKLNVDSDPNGVLENWNADHCDPCMWSGVECLDGKVQTLNLNGCSLEGMLASELGNLTHLRSLVLSGNHFFGAIPKEFGRLGMLEVLDLRDNNLSGTLPAEIGHLQSLRVLLIHNNNFEESVPSEIGKLHLVTELQFDENLSSAFAAGTLCIRKFRHCIWHGSLKPVKTINSFIEPIKWTLFHYLSFFQLPSPGTRFMDDRKDCSGNLPRSSRPHIVQNIQHQEDIARRKLVEQSSNFAAVPVNIKGPLGPVIQMPSSRSSGSFRAVPNSKGRRPIHLPSPPPQHESQDKLHPLGQSTGAVKQPTNSQGSPAGKSETTWKYVAGICFGVFSLILAVSVFLIYRIRAARAIVPWKTGLSGQLQKAFITGVPKLNRSELETASEDFSNIICSGDSYIVYKGTLSSGVEIAVISTTISSLSDWSEHSETTFRKKINTFSRVNHKNFVNLIGYCEDDEPFTRMMVFEYAPNGSLFEHLHVEEADHLDWPTRMRAIMGTAYSLQYMHELNPPVPHCNLDSKAIFLTDDYAAKITERDFWSELTATPKSSGDDLGNSLLPPLADPETNVYSFGILLLEITSGKSPYSGEKESLLNWVAQYIGHDKQNIAALVDPTLKSFKNNELMVICEVIEQCLQEDPRKRPTIKEVIDKLREAIDVSPEAAVPRLSPLWWAELELLSSEAA
ncbi:unnamed protein product [Withania somnifera]